MRTPTYQSKQSGVVMFITLIALVILLLSCIALVRSTDTALLISGNLAVKRDLTNQAETAISSALATFATAGALGTEPSRWANAAGANYSSTMLPTNADGVPTILLDTATFNSTYSAPAPAATNGITSIYVIDRFCSVPGAGDLAHCTTGNSVASTGGDAYSTQPGGAAAPTSASWVYRISVRVTDARQTQSFVQTTFKSYGS